MHALIHSNANRVLDLIPDMLDLDCACVHDRLSMAQIAS